MAAEGPWLLVALEQSALGLAIRQSVWAYPIANILHVATLAVLAGAVAVMDLRLLGAFAATHPADVVRPARRVAIGALAGMLATGSVLFIAEASHVAANPVFRAKLALIGLALANAGLVAGLLRRTLERAGPLDPMPPRLRAAAAISLALWLLIAASGRLIAYV